MALEVDIAFAEDVALYYKQSRYQAAHDELVEP